ncbi:TIGR01244 family sulfur transferase [Sulfitobacter sp. F26169L]|uniref:TIGR01244 family sulfur transferase n=1 Tax=Sulfitobacter sp. F26169L TaxID=2996015 RepID=UPI002260C651|nr:TIGR01244 family sulfur transferase [Sulfitobacter sp. F26169L]MCX7565132.1 TIGR01244 family sulfur transferase [Sulfitobacter sp. F26169L]
MDIRQLTPRYFVGPQIAPDQMNALKEAGITRILCNRPDEEVPAELSAQSLQAAAQAAGLEFAVQPLTHSTMTEENVARNRALGADQDGVTFAYCASGTRSCIAWALGQAGKQSADEIIAAGKSAGYDLENLRPYLEQHAA